MPADPVRVCETRAAMTVNLTRIYTKLGDGGETHLGDMSRVSKLDSRVEAYGTVDELNATIGVALLQEGLPRAFAAWLRRVQNDLLDLGADLSVPAPPVDDSSAGKAKREPLHSFVIPGGTPAAAHLHICRTVCRRAERRAIAVGAEVNPEVVRYLNRLSDMLFILGRAANQDWARSESPSSESRAGSESQAGSEPLWDPGAHDSDSASRPARSGARLGG